MSQFDQPQAPRYTPDQLAGYLRDTDGALATSLRVLARGYEASRGVYKPWPKKDVKKLLATILALFVSKVKYFQGANEPEKAKAATEKVERLRKVFSEIDNSENVSEGFLKKVQQTVESEMSS